MDPVIPLLVLSLNCLDVLLLKVVGFEELVEEGQVSPINELIGDSEDTLSCSILILVIAEYLCQLCELRLDPVLLSCLDNPDCDPLHNQKRSRNVISNLFRTSS